MDKTSLLLEQQNDSSVEENVSQRVSTEVIYRRTCPPQMQNEETKENNITFQQNTPKLKRKVQLVKKKFRTIPTKIYIANSKKIISIYETFMTAALESHGKKMSCRKGSVEDSEKLVDQMKVLMQWFPSEIKRWKCKYEEKEKSDKLNEERMEKMFEKCKPNIAIYENCFHKQSGIYNVMEFKRSRHDESNPQLTDFQTEVSCSHETINAPLSKHGSITIQPAENQNIESITASESYTTEYESNTSLESDATECESNSSLENQATGYETKEYTSNTESFSENNAKGTVYNESVLDESNDLHTEEQNIEYTDECNTCTYVERCLNCIDALNETLTHRNSELFSIKRLNEMLNQRNAEMSFLMRLYEIIVQEIEPKVDELLELTRSKSKTFGPSSKRKRRETLLVEIKRWLQSLLQPIKTDSPRSDLVEITEQAVASIQLREDFCPLNRDSLPEAAKPLHTWISVKYGHKPQLLQKFLYGSPEECFKPNENEKLDIYAMFLVTWIKSDKENTPEQLLEIFNQLDDYIATGNGTLPRQEENPSQNL